MSPFPHPGRLVRAEIRWDEVPDREAFPYSIPGIAALQALDLDTPVTFLVGENGSGKSTLLEAIALAASLNAEGGSRNVRFSSRRTESDLHEHLHLAWSTRRQHWAFFLRSETFFNTATAYEEEYEIPGFHERSHGEQFIDVAMRMFQPGGLHLMDEPEAALSALGQLKLLRRMHDVAAEDGQFLVATHSPILLALPGARIYEFSDTGLDEVAYEDTQPYQLTRSFLDSPERFLRHLLTDEDEHEDA